MNINELEEHKCYKSKDMFYTYLFRFRKWEVCYSDYAMVYHEQFYRKVGGENFYASNGAFSIAMGTQFELVPDNIANKLFKIIEMSISTVNTLI